MAQPSWSYCAPAWHWFGATLKSKYLNVQQLNSLLILFHLIREKQRNMIISTFLAVRFIWNPLTKAPQWPNPPGHTVCAPCMVIYCAPEWHRNIWRLKSKYWNVQHLTSLLILFYLIIILQKQMQNQMFPFFMIIWNPLTKSFQWSYCAVAN